MMINKSERYVLIDSWITDMFCWFLIGYAIGKHF